MNLIYRTNRSQTADSCSSFSIKSLISKFVHMVSRFTQRQSCCGVCSEWFNTSVTSSVTPLSRVGLSVESITVANDRLHHSSCGCEELCLMVLQCQAIQDFLSTGTHIRTCRTYANQTNLDFLCLKRGITLF